VHFVPQVPQLLGSLASFVQAPLQLTSFVGQVPTQLPRLQSGVVPEQTVPHWPQLFGSDCRLTQMPLQDDSP
jgi:hypothetical protein